MLQKRGQAYKRSLWTSLGLRAYFRSHYAWCTSPLSDAHRHQRNALSTVFPLICTYLSASARSMWNITLYITLMVYAVISTLGSNYTCWDKDKIPSHVSVYRRRVCWCLMWFNRRIMRTRINAGSCVWSKVGVYNKCTYLGIQMNVHDNWRNTTAKDSQILPGNW